MISAMMIAIVGTFLGIILGNEFVSFFNENFFAGTNVEGLIDVIGRFIMTFTICLTYMIVYIRALRKAKQKYNNM